MEGRKNRYQGGLHSTRKTSLSPITKGDIHMNDRLKAALDKAAGGNGKAPQSTWQGDTYQFADVDEALEVIGKLCELPEDKIAIDTAAMTNSPVLPDGATKVVAAQVRGRNGLKGLTVTAYHNGKVVTNNTALWAKALGVDFPNA